MEIRATVSRGHTISYEDHGEGKALVLVPGLGSPAREWADRGYVELLADHFRVLVADPLGHGRSDVPADPGEYLQPDVSEDIVAVMDAAGVERAAVWGYSRGSSLAAVVAAAHPERVDSLVLGGFSPRSGPPDFEIPASAQAMLNGDWQGAFEAWAADGVDLSESDRQYMIDYSHPQGVAGSQIGSSRSSYTIDLSRITCPVFVYYGSGDLVDDPRPAEICAVLGTRLVVLPATTTTPRASTTDPPSFRSCSTSSNGAPRTRSKRAVAQRATDAVGSRTWSSMFSTTSGSAGSTGTVTPPVYGRFEKRWARNEWVRPSSNWPRENSRRRITSNMPRRSG
jgi:pimeloyl-ACP methyl ester carboxylesterase